MLYEEIVQIAWVMLLSANAKTKGNRSQEKMHFSKGSLI